MLNQRNLRSPAFPSARPAAEGSPSPDNRSGTSAGESDRSQGSDVLGLEQEPSVSKSPIFEPREQTQVDHFVLTKELGGGAYGRVWLARDLQLQRNVAIKFPRFDLTTNQSSARRFQREAEIAAGLSHPNLIPILEAVLTPEKAYIVSEYCPGPTLTQWMNEQDRLLRVDTAVSIVAQIANGLRAAHERNLMHRDIKPSNVIISDDAMGRPFANLTDFGMARSMNDERDVNETLMGTLIGSAPYMSPEQACGRVEMHGFHSDVFSLGVVLYELLTGVSPFTAATQMQVIQRVMDYDPPPIRKIRPTVSRDLSAVVQRCLEKSPARRYQDAGKLYEDLICVAQRRPTSARPIGVIGRATRWAARNPLVAMFAWIAVFGVLFGIASLSMFALKQRQHAAKSLAHANELRLALDHAEDSRERLYASRYDSDLTMAYLMFNRGQYGEARRLLNRQLPSEGERDLRSIEWDLLDSEVSAKYALWGKHQKRAGRLVGLPDQQTVVSSGDDGKLIFWDIETGTERHRLDGFQGQSTAIAALPNGKLAIPGPEWPLGFRGVIVIDPATGQTEQALQVHPTTISSIRVAGDKLASGCRYHGIKVWSFSKQKAIAIPGRLRNSSIGLSSDGSTLVSGEKEVNSLRFFDTETGILNHEFVLPAPAVLVQCGQQHDWAAYTVQGKQGFGITPMQKSESNGESCWVSANSIPLALAFSQHDTAIAIADSHSGIQWFNRHSADGDGDSIGVWESTAYVSGAGGRVTDVEFLSADDVLTTALDGAVERFSPNRVGHERFVRPATRSECVGSAITSDFRSILVVTDDNVVQVGDLPDQAEAGDPLDSQGNIAVAYRDVWKAKTPIRAIALSPDDKTIVLSDSFGRLIWLRDWRSGEPTVHVTPLPKRGRRDFFAQLRFSPSGRYLAVGGDSDVMLVFDTSNSLDQPAFLRDHDKETHCFAFSSSERELVYCGDGELELLDLESGRSRIWQTTSEQASCVEFAPDAKRIVVGWQDGSLSVFDLETTQLESVMQGGASTGDYAMRPSAIRFLSNDRLLMMTHGGTLLFCDLDKRLQLGTFTVWKSVNYQSHCDAIRLSDDATQLIVSCNASGDSRVCRWQISNHRHHKESGNYAKHKTSSVAPPTQWSMEAR
ncbi:Serine/threonine-protein kinase PknB [Novipirellula galeiformis]|uniref:Serine/threonine-protein kinase PknB n=1 Tax=Novipirellula galeiformis TaxID=2528004 RepID=A0A5C6BZ89_9BACT|nr:protein kinase [Novipirellula galeiformis]TWU17660.1 Serine/threonine-protein kinase PknB [Novipirellula galeiformis]